MDPSEEYRLTLLQRLEHRYRETQKAKAEIDKRAEEERAAVARLRAPLPAPDLCPECFYLRNIVSHLKPVPFDTVGLDKFRCSECGHTEERAP